jgi:hypothetical protein
VEESNIIHLLTEKKTQNYPTINQHHQQAIKVFYLPTDAQ